MPLPKKGEAEEILPFLKDSSDDDWRKIVAYYYTLVSHVDDCV